MQYLTARRNQEAFQGYTQPLERRPYLKIKSAEHRAERAYSAYHAMPDDLTDEFLEIAPTFIYKPDAMR